MNNTLNLALRRVSRKLCVDKKLVEDVYRSYWCFIKSKVTQVPLREISEEEFNLLETNVNLPLLGKLYVEYDKIERYRKHLKYLEDAKAKESEADRLPGTGD